MAAAPQTKSDVSAAPPVADASFEHYGRLLKMLMPSMRGVLVHDGFSNVVWASDDWDVADDPQIGKQAIANALRDPAEFAGIMCAINADRVLYSFAHQRHAE